MTEEQIKAMLNGIINNGEKWEYRPKGYYCSEEQKYVDEQCDYDACAHTCRDNCYSDWRPYKLGDEIHEDWEYREVHLFCVLKIKDSEYVCGYKKALLSPETVKTVFEGSKEECEKWIEEHTKKSWFEDYLKLFPKSGQKETCRIVCKEVTKKIMEEIAEKQSVPYATCEPIELTYDEIKLIIKDLGIEL